MTGMSMPEQTWYDGAARYLGMWMAMMVPMMLPSLAPVLLRYRRSVLAAGGLRSHGLTMMVGAGYYLSWAALGVPAYGVSAGMMALEARWATIAAGLMLLAAGIVQLTPWKARQLARCREGAVCECRFLATAGAAWRHGLELGVRCALCCGTVMLALLTVGMMDLVAMAAVTLAITAERLTPAPLRAARVTGVAIIVLGLLTIVRM